MKGFPLAAIKGALAASTGVTVALLADRLRWGGLNDDWHIDAIVFWILLFGGMTAGFYWEQRRT